MEDSVACSAARPLLVSTPISMNPANDAVGSRCTLALMKKDPVNCNTLSSMFPPGLNQSVAPAFKVGGGNYTCLQRDRDKIGGSKYVGKMVPNLCTTILNVSEWKNATRIQVGCKDLYWLCGPDVANLTPDLDQADVP